jgi:hypothetical protein
MTAAAYFQPKFEQNHVGKKLVNFSSDTFNCGLIASGTLASRSVTEGYEFVSDLLTNGGSALVEVSTGGTGYSRQGLASVSYTVSALVVTITAANPSWSSATFTTNYAWVHDETASSGSDSTRPLLAIFDLGGSQPVSGNTFTLAVNASGLVTWTAAA